MSTGAQSADSSHFRFRSGDPVEGPRGRGRITEGYASGGARAACGHERGLEPKREQGAELQ